MTDTQEVRVVWPEHISATAVESENRGVVGVLTVEAGGDSLNLAVQPKQVRQLAALLLDLSDRLDELER